MAGITSALNGAVSGAISAAGSALGAVSLTALINDLNNITDLLNMFNNGWIEGNEPLLSNMYIFQPNLREGNFIPRQLVKSVSIPDRTIQTSSIKFRGIDIKFPSGATTGNFKARFYERQDLIVTGFYEAWKSYAVSPTGDFYGLPNQVKFDMLVVLNNSMTAGNSSITGKIINSLPQKVNEAISEVNFAGLVLLVGCFPVNVTYPDMANPDNGQVDAVEVEVDFSCDICVKIPLSLNIDQILEILGISQAGFKPDINKTINDTVNKGINKATNYFSN